VYQVGINKGIKICGLRITDCGFTAYDTVLLQVEINPCDNHYESSLQDATI